MKAQVAVRTDNSRSLFEKALRVTPAGVHSDVRGLPGWAPYPIFVERGIGSKVIDVDGNEYIDYRLAYGPLILGHAHPRIISAVGRQLERGSMFGACHESEIKLAQKITEHVPCAEMVKFSNTGTEAVMHAIRLARAYTNREKIVKFEGHYHGWSDETFLSVQPQISVAGPEENPTKVPGSQGILRDTERNTLVLPSNNPKALQKAIEQQGNDIAAVIVEPLTYADDNGFLRTLRSVTAQNDILLILDEIKTGFRLGLGGAQTYFNIKPDLAVLAKALGGGFPISAVTGTKEIMKLFEPGKVTYSGTYNSSPICVAAALATLEELEAGGGEAFARMYKIGERLISGLKKIFNEAGLKCVVRGPGVMFNTFFTELEVIRDYRDACTNNEKLYKAFWRDGLNRGVLFGPSALQHWFISTAHTEGDIERTVSVLEKSLEVMQAD